jgi:tetratricopeptide (TPR) repeat protein
MLHNLNKDLDEYYEDLGDEHYDAGRFNEAIDAYFRALTFEPNNGAYLHSQLGSAFFNLADYGAAVSHYQRSLELEYDSDIVVNLGAAYYAQGDNDKAINCFIGAIKDNLQDGDAYNRLAVAYCQAGCYAQAIIAHECAVNLNNKYQASYLISLKQIPKDVADKFLGYLVNQDNESKMAFGYFQVFILNGKRSDNDILAELKQIIRRVFSPLDESTKKAVTKSADHQRKSTAFNRNFFLTQQGQYRFKEGSKSLNTLPLSGSKPTN